MWVTTRHYCRSISEAFVSVVAECCSKNHATCPRASSAPPPFLNTVKTHIPSAQIHSVMRVGPFQYCTCTCHTCVPHTTVSPVPVCNPIDQRCDLQALHLWTDLQALAVKLSRYLQVRDVFPFWRCLDNLASSWSDPPRVWSLPRKSLWVIAHRVTVCPHGQENARKTTFR